MKQCSQGGREYDNSMLFCLDDGAELLYGPAATDEPATAILANLPSEAATKHQINTTDKTAILPNNAATEKAPFKEIPIADKSGIFFQPNIFMTPDGKSYIYNVRRYLMDLYLADGLK